MNTIDDDVIIEGNANLVLQVNRSHLDRVSDFLTQCHCDGDVDVGGGTDANNNYVVRILATQKSTASKSCSLILLHATDGLAFITRLIKQHNFVLLGLNKVYIIPEGEGSIFRGSFASIDEKRDELYDNKSIDQYLFNKLMGLRTRQQRSNTSSSPSKRSVVVKVDVFPSKLQHRVVSILTSSLDNYSIPEEELDISPTNYTHVLSIIQMDDAETSTTMSIHSYLVGITSVEQSAPTIYPPDSSTNDICRAYYKLAEVFERYRHQSVHTANSLPFPFSNPIQESSGSKRKQPATTKPRIAVDCGSAPGGWTKYLIEQTSCDEVYSIDPGDLEASVLALPNVHHLKMTAARAIPELIELMATRHDTKIALWVSDMCVHDIPKQVDMFQSAYDHGLFEKENAAFVLTIKCNKGHGRERFDKLVEEEASRLQKMGAHGVMTFHLFSNRIGERTIAGFIDS
jgi:hypothetical protein